MNYICEVVLDFFYMKARGYASSGKVGPSLPEMSRLPESQEAKDF